ncbi:hypothetical protein RYX36_030898, partial [Vicia faba]
AFTITIPSPQFPNTLILSSLHNSIYSPIFGHANKPEHPSILVPSNITTIQSPFVFIIPPISRIISQFGTPNSLCQSTTKSSANYHQPSLFRQPTIFSPLHLSDEKQPPPCKATHGRDNNHHNSTPMFPLFLRFPHHHFPPRSFLMW